MSEKLKPCPFCGATSAYVAYDYGDYVSCPECGAAGPHRLRAKEKGAIVAWNRRVK